MISREGYLPIDRTKLSKALIPDANQLLLRPQEWYDSASIGTVSDEVTSIDFEANSVSTASGESFPYTKLVLATGGTPKKLPLPGFNELQNIFVLRSAVDVQAILSSVGESKGKNVVVIGSSFIGMEVGNALAKDNRVTVVGMEKVPLERVMGERVGGTFQRLLEKNGVAFRMSAGVEKATSSPTDPRSVGAVHLKDGTVLPADLVVLGVGVAPETAYLRSSLPAGVQLESDGSLRTDESFAVVGLPDVYAVGDIATYPYQGPGGGGSPVRIEHWSVAQNAGRVAGAAIADPSAPPARFTPVFWSALGSQLRYCGNTVGGYDDVVVKGQPHEAQFAAFYAKGEEVVAVATMGMDPVMAKCADLMRRGAMVGKKDLEAGKDVLKVV